MGLEVDGGLEEIEAKLKELEFGLSEKAIQKWATTVENWAKTTFEGKADDIKIVVKKVGNKIDLEPVFHLSEERECLKQAIKANLPQMPETTRTLFSTMLSKLEHR